MEVVWRGSEFGAKLYRVPPSWPCGTNEAVHVTLSALLPSHETGASKLKTLTRNGFYLFLGYRRNKVPLPDNKRLNGPEKLFFLCLYYIIHT